jgi:hypothetical protein
MPVDITEYDRLAIDNIGNTIAAGVEPSRVVQQIAASGVSAACAADFSDTTRFVRIHTDVAVRIAFGKSPTAAPTSQRMAAGATEYFGVTPGIRVAAITTT